MRWFTIKLTCVSLRPLQRLGLPSIHSQAQGRPKRTYWSEYGCYTTHTLAQQAAKLLRTKSVSAEVVEHQLE